MLSIQYQLQLKKWGYWLSSGIASQTPFLIFTFLLGFSGTIAFFLHYFLFAISTYYKLKDEKSDFLKVIAATRPWNPACPKEKIIADHLHDVATGYGISPPQLRIEKNLSTHTLPTAWGWPHRPLVTLPAFFIDAYLQHLSPAYVRAVFAHELSHLKQFDFALGRISAICRFASKFAFLVSFFILLSTPFFALYSFNASLFSCLLLLGNYKLAQISTQRYKQLCELLADNHAAQVTRDPLTIAYLNDERLALIFRLNRYLILDNETHCQVFSLNKKESKAYERRLFKWQKNHQWTPGQAFAQLCNKIKLTQTPACIYKQTHPSNVKRRQFIYQAFFPNKAPSFP